MGRKRIYTINEEYFSIENETPNKYYILGFIYADGGVNNNYLTITIHKKDISVLEFIKSELNYNGPLYYKGDNKQYVSLTISSKKICNDLKLYGIIPNKTYKSKGFNIPEKYINSFLLGFFDGDGSVYHSENTKKSIKEYTVSFSNNKYVLSFLKDFLKDNDISTSKIRFRHDSIYSGMLECRGNINIEKMYTLLYEKSFCTFSMLRKKNKFLEFKQELKKLKRRYLKDEVIELIKEEYFVKGKKQYIIAKEMNLVPSTVRAVVQRLRKQIKNE